MRRSGVACVAAAIAVVLTCSACADTVIEGGASSPEPVGADGSVETIPTTTLPIEGSALELLPEMALEMSQLSSQIADEGDERATLQRIEAIWIVAQPEVEATRRDLAGGIQTAIDMARNAVVRVRPADADKAFSILTDLVDRYTGDA